MEDELVSFNSKMEMDALSKTRERVVVWMGSTAVFIMLAGVALDIVLENLYSKAPITTFIRTSQYRWPVFVAVFILFWVYARSRLGRRQRQIFQGYQVVLSFNRGEAAIQKGIARNAPNLVSNGVEQLEDLEPCCSKMPEYKELLSRGRAWLSEH